MSEYRSGAAPPAVVVELLGEARQRQLIFSPVVESPQKRMVNSQRRSSGDRRWQSREIADSVPLHRLRRRRRSRIG